MDEQVDQQDQVGQQDQEGQDAAHYSITVALPCILHVTVVDSVGDAPEALSREEIEKLITQATDAVENSNTVWVRGHEAQAELMFDPRAESACNFFDAANFAPQVFMDAEGPKWQGATLQVLPDGTAVFDYEYQACIAKWRQVQLEQGQTEG